MTNQPVVIESVSTPMAPAPAAATTATGAVVSFVENQAPSTGSRPPDAASPPTSDTSHRISADSLSVEAAFSSTNTGGQQTEAASPPVSDGRQRIYAESASVYAWLFDRAMAIKANYGRKSALSRKTTRLLKSFVAWRTLLNTGATIPPARHGGDGTVAQMGFAFAAEGDDQQYPDRMDGGMEPLVSGNVRG